MPASPERKIGLKYSAIAHVVVLILIIFGLPSLWKSHRDPEPMAITVDIVPIGPISNIKPSAPKPEQEKEEPKEKADAKNDKPTPVKQEEAKPKVAEPLEKTKKEEPKPKEEEKPKEKDKKVEDELDAILKSVEKTAKEKATSSSAEKSDTKAKSDTYDASLPLSLSEVDAIRSQFIKCWSVPAGAQSAENLVVVLKVQVNQDGSVAEAKLAEDKGRYNSDSYFRAAVDSAIRAVYKCSPLKNLPADRYGSWKDMKLTFDPKEMLF